MPPRLTSTIRSAGLRPSRAASASRLSVPRRATGPTWTVSKSDIGIDGVGRMKRVAWR